jgi:hypothetical protein
MIVGVERGRIAVQWNLPLWEQINLARQNIYDGTLTKAPSQGWMFVPLVQYHGGWPECCIEPAGFLAGQWEVCTMTMCLLSNDCRC